MKRGNSMDIYFLEEIGFQHLSIDRFLPEKITLRDGHPALLWLDTETNHGVLDAEYWVPESHYEHNYRSAASGNYDGERFTPEDHVESYRSLDKQQFSRVAPLLRPDSKVLEIGCSYGGVLKEVVRFGVDVCHAVEPNKEDARFVKSSIPEVNLIEDLFLDADLPESYYDVILSFQVMEHVPSPRRFLEKIHALLKQGGSVHIEVPNHNAALLRNYKEARHSIFYYHKHHIHYFSVQSLNRLCHLCGFKGEVTTDSMYPFFNHVYWHFNKKPQKTAAVALNTPDPADNLTDAGRSINEFYKNVEMEYGKLVRQHGVGDILICQSTKI